MRATALLPLVLAAAAGAALAQQLPPRPTATPLADPTAAAWPMAIAEPFDAFEGPGDAMTAIAALDGERAVVLRVDLEGVAAWRTELPIAGGTTRRDADPRLVALRGGDLLVVSDLDVHYLRRDGSVAWRIGAAALGLRRIDSAAEAGPTGFVIGGSGSRNAACNRAPDRCDDFRAMAVAFAPAETIGWRYAYEAPVPAQRGRSTLDMQVLARFGRGGAQALALPAPDATHGHARLLWLDERGRLARNAAVEIPRTGAGFDRDVVAQRRNDGTLVLSSVAPAEAASATIHVQTLAPDGRRRSERTLRIPTRFADATACVVQPGAREVGAGFVLQRLQCRTGTAAERAVYAILRFDAPAGEARTIWLDESERPLRVSADGRVVLAFAGGRIVRLALPGEQN